MGFGYIFRKKVTFPKQLVKSFVQGEVGKILCALHCAGGKVVKSYVQGERGSHSWQPFGTNTCMDKTDTLPGDSQSANAPF